MSPRNFNCRSPFERCKLKSFVGPSIFFYTSTSLLGSDTLILDLHCHGQSVRPLSHRSFCKTISKIEILLN
uniref:Uncharacterized protein n=1 Tax=uncultured nuHF1 cluster bacterium HF0130_31E21 TaxID=710728 RepID=E0XTN4_9BACT|nr:hypothetical protein [uncultured nuHF1 cluster bacterium HF0130_31E21]